MVLPITLTDSARDKALELLRREGREDLKLRVQVGAGGCSGLVYKVFFDEYETEDDEWGEFGELEVLVDKLSAPYLTGAVIDYKDDLMEQGFKIDNPNAHGSCACGDSFH